MDTCICPRCKKVATIVRQEPYKDGMMFVYIECHHCRYILVTRDDWKKVNT